MNIDEAYKLMGVSNNISDEDLKKKYRELSKLYHPDIYKLDENKFRDINAAYQLINDYRKNPNKYNTSPNMGGFNINDFISDFENLRPQKIIQSPVVVINITFKESILGCEKEISYNRNVKCNTCNGGGFSFHKNGCKSCDGFGKIVTNQRGIIYTQSCNKCYARGVSKSQCASCKGEGSVEDNLKGSVSIPPGTHDASTLVLRNKGHYAGSSMFGENYTDVYLQVHVAKEDGLELIGNDVVSNIQISLLEALMGCKKEVKTIHGIASISVPESSKNKDEVKIPGCGVKNGQQKVILNIDYPKNTQALIELLKQGLN